MTEPMPRVEQMYIALLLLPHNALRTRLQAEMATCRDAIALIHDREPQDIQDEFELRAANIASLIAGGLGKPT